MYFVDSFQEEVWKKKYQYKGESYDEFCNRVVTNIFPDSQEKAAKLKQSMLDFRTLFGGRINSNIGIKEKGLTLFNCFIEAVGKDPDSLEGIMDMITKYAITLKSEGGVGFCANFFRPTNTIIRKIGVASPGPIKFLEIFDKVSEVITSGSVTKETCYQGVPTKNSIRKGATMVTMSCCHPDIEEFITAKLVPNRLTKMNMSVLITDAFMYAVDHDLDWDLWFPNINCEEYTTEWDGDFEKWAEKGYSTVVYKTIKATYLWDLLLKSSHTHNEPGLLFIDTIRRMDNVSYLGSSINATNPCFTGDMLLHTSNGMERIYDLYKKGVPNKVYVDNRQIDGTMGTTLKEATHVYKTGNKEVFKIITNAGYEIKATEYHKFHTTDGTKELKDLKLGDSLYICSGKCGFGDNGTLDFGRLIGLVAGDGTIYEGWSEQDSCKVNKVIIRLWGKDKVLVDDVVAITNFLIKRYGENYSNVTISARYVKNKDMYEISSGVLYRIFKKFELLNIKKEVPKFIFKGTEDFMKGYLQGLFQTDGTINTTEKSGCTVRLNSSMLSLIKDVQILLSNFGIRSNINLRRKEGYRNLPDGHGGIKKYWCKDNFELILFSISRDLFMNSIGFILDYKNDKFFKWRNKHNVSTQKFCEIIKSIESIGFEDVYCLTQNDYHSVICNGFSTGQCGEVVGNTGVTEYNGKLYELGDICNLGSLNLIKYYNIITKQFDFEVFKEDIRLMVEALDNVIDISEYPLDMYELAAKMKRKIGLGIAGVGSLFMLMNVKYGSKESIDIIESILHIFINEAYRASALLAKEKGPFDLYTSKALNTGYLKRSGVLQKDVLDLIKQYGLRNSALTAIAPNGTLAIVAGNISGGLEPVFATEYVRWVRVEDRSVDFDYPNISKGEWYETDYFKEFNIADEPVLNSTDGKYRIDKNQGLCKKEIIMDAGYRIAKDTKNTEFATATELSVSEHLNILKVFAKYIDLSCSKTINLPATISFEDFKALYGNIHKYGIKGCTTYREGTSVAILETKKEKKLQTIKDQQAEFIDAFKEHINGNIVYDVIKLPEEYPSKGYILRAEKKKWYIHVAFKDEAKTKPFAIFVNTNDQSPSNITNKALIELSKVAKKYKLGGKKLTEVEKKYSRQPNSVKIARMLGYLFRHNVPMVPIVKALGQVDDANVGTFVFRIKKFLTQFITDPMNDLGLVCSECGSKDVVLQEGCSLCRSCGASACS